MVMFLTGDKAITRLFNNQRGQSCCGLAYELLVAGGILSLTKMYQDLMLKWVVVTVDNFKQFILNAKQQELEKFPETQKFGTPHKQESQNCIIQ